MDREDWTRTSKVLQASSLRLTAALRALTEAPQFNGLDAAGTAAQQHISSIFSAVSDAKQELTLLRKQIAQGQQQQPPAQGFIQELASRISRFTEVLSSLKTQQRQQYSSLLQQEQQLLEDLASLQISTDSASNNQDCLQQHSSYDDSGSSLQDSVSNTAHDACAMHSPNKTYKMQRQRSSKTPRRSSVADDSNTTKASMRPSTASIAAGQQISSGSPTPKANAASSSSSTTPHASGSSVCGSTLLPEVVAYDDFVARHGVTGGWHPDDHTTFLAVLRRSRGDYSAALACAVDALPGITRQQVIAHSRWHADLVELDMRKRVALVNWRAARDAAKAARQAEAATLQDTQASLQAQQQQPDQLEKEVRQLQKQMVAQWKAERLAAQQQQAQQEAEQEQKQREREQAQLQQKRAALKQQLEAAKAAKQQMAAVTAQASALQIAASAVPRGQVQQQQVQQRLAQRNAAIMSRRQQLVAAKQNKQAAREKVQQQLLSELEDAKPKATRDPGRLLSATAAAAARAARAAEEAAEKQTEGGAAGRGSIGSGFVLHLGHKAVPAWASGMRL